MTSNADLNYITTFISIFDSKQNLANTFKWPRRLDQVASFFDTWTQHRTTIPLVVSGLYKLKEYILVDLGPLPLYVPLCWWAMVVGPQH
jgi:hypothetical protein